MGLFKDIFLTKQDKQVLEIYNNINNYWKNTNDFVIAHIRYLHDLDFKYKLNFSEEIITDLPYLVLTPLIEKGLSQYNSIFIFSQIIVFYVFRNANPKINRYSDENLFWIAENIEKLLIPYKSHVTPEFKFQVVKDLDVISITSNKNIPKIGPVRSEKNREFSKNQLASNNGCSPNMLKQRIFEQLDTMGVTVEVINEVILKYKEAKFEQSKQFNMHPDDTPAALFIEMTEEYIERLKFNSNDDQIYIERTEKGYNKSDKDEDDLPF